MGWKISICNQGSDFHYIEELELVPDVGLEFLGFCLE